MDENEAIRRAEEAYLRGLPAVASEFVAIRCDRVSETWVVAWNLRRDDGSVVRKGGNTTLVSGAGRTRLAPHPPASLTDAVRDFEAPHRPVAGEEHLPDGWSLERIKDLGIAAPVLVTRQVRVRRDDGDGPVEVAPKAILEVGGLCLVLGRERDDWHMGQWADADTIVCWASYGSDLEQAINAL